MPDLSLISLEQLADEILKRSETAAIVISYNNPDDGNRFIFRYDGIWKDILGSVEALKIEITDDFRQAKED